MKLTDTNITELYKFTRKHYVEHYDVQTELVDHLANDIEAIWEENPNLSFEKARDKSFKKFGVFGFMNVVEEKQKQLGKRYRKVLWSYVKEWFGFPKVLLSISIFLIFYYILQLTVGIYILGILLFILAISDVYFATKLKREFNVRTQKNNKKWMLEEMIYNVASFGGIMVASNLPQLFVNVNNVPSNTIAIVISLVLTITVIYSYITLIIIPNKADELLEEQYPEYKLV